MRIALLTDGIYPYVLGGMQKHSYYLARYMARNGVQVDLYHTGSKEADTTRLKEFSEEELAFITPYYVPFPSVSKLPGHYVLESYLYSKQLYKLLKEQESVDFIYAQGFTGWKTIVEKRKGVQLPEIAVNFHGLNMYQYKPTIKAKAEAGLLRLATGTILRKSDYVVSLGGKLTDLIKKVGVCKSRIIEQPVAIEPHWLSKVSFGSYKHLETRSFVFVGRYDKVKGIDLLNEVLTSIKHLDYRFHFIGPIPKSAQLVNKNVEYHGLVKEEEKIKSILATADVLVCPSYSEGMPTVILEAMAAGLAVIATDVGAVNALVHENTGWLIPAGNKEALRQALVTAITCDETQLRAKKINARKLVAESYTWDKVIAATLDQISTLVE